MLLDMHLPHTELCQFPSINNFLECPLLRLLKVLALAIALFPTR